MYNLIAILFILFAIIYKSAYNNGSPTCSRFILNTYLYVFIGIVYTLLVGIFTSQKLFENKSFNLNMFSKMNNFSQNIYLFIYLFILFLIFYLTSKIYTIPVDQTFNKHLYFVLYLTIVGVILWPFAFLYKIAPVKIITQIMIIFFGIIVVASFIAVKFPEYVSKLLFPLMLVLFGLIFYYLFYNYFGLEKYLNYRTSIIISIILFSIFISYDTHILLQRQHECVEGRADYVKYSLQLYVDFINILTDLLRLFSSK
jgi:FtsH-binding integral membrane protein